MQVYVHSYEYGFVKGDAIYVIPKECSFSLEEVLHKCMGDKSFWAALVEVDPGSFEADFLSNGYYTALVLRSLHFESVDY